MSEPKEISNAEVKAHPLFVGLTKELAAERESRKAEMAELKERLGAFETAETERKTKQLESKKKYEEATQARIDQALDAARKEWEQQAITDQKISDAKLALVKAGFSNDAFIKGVLTDFDPSKDDAAKFAESVAADEGNKAFLKPASKKNDPHPPAPAPGGVLTPAEIQALRETGKPEDALKADEAAMTAWTESNRGLNP